MTQLSVPPAAAIPAASPFADKTLAGASLLQRRLWTMLVMLAATSVVGLAAHLIVSAVSPSSKSPHPTFILLSFLSACVVTLTGAWLVRPGPTRSYSLLHFVDAAVAVYASGVMCMMILIPTGRIDEVYLALICSGLIVVGRALFIPTSSRRTMWLAIACGALTFGATLALALGFPERLSLPRSAFVVNNLFCSAFPIVVATAGSRVIVGLREKVREARRLGQYVLGEKLGEGGMGIVYMAHHAMLRRPTAIKVLPEKLSSAAAVLSFEREVQLTAELTGPHVVSIFDYGRSPDGTFYYAMEYVDGLDLEALVRDHGPQPQARVARILGQVCDALEEAHAHGLIHRDIKPANILLGERLARVDVVKVVDFGVVHELRGGTSHGEAGSIVGTPAYLSPEAISAPAEVQAASDIYAVGAVGYYLLTGRRVFDGRTFAELCAQHLTETPIPPSQQIGIPLDSRWDALLLRCLAKQPELRPPSASALRLELDELAASLPHDPDVTQAWWLAFRARRAAKKASSVDVEAKTLAATPAE